MKAATPIRRSRSNDGHNGTRLSVLPIRPELLAKLIAEFHEVRARREIRIYHGPKAVRGNRPSRLSDEQVLTMRRMRDHHGMSIAKIAKALGESIGAVEAICDYRTRGHLDPGPRPAPNLLAV